MRTSASSLTFAANEVRTEPRRSKSILGQIPAARFGSPLEIANAAVFFASDESGFTVGSEFIIDGGMSTL